MGLKVKIQDTFIKSSIAFLSFKLILKLVGLASVGLIVFISTSLGEGQHDLHLWTYVFALYFEHCRMDLPHTWTNSSVCDFEIDHMLPVGQCDLYFTVQ